MGQAEDAGSRGAQPHISPALKGNRHWSRGSRSWGRSQRSLVRFSKDIVLFALHVLKVKGRASHAFVDVFDVIAGGLKVCGGIIGTGAEHLKRAGPGPQ